MKQTAPFIITINRQLGSGGAYVGQSLAKKLEVLYADREIINQAAQKLSVLVEELESYDEKINSFWKSFLQMYPYSSFDGYIMPPISVMPTDQELFETEAEVIKHIAKEGSAVIIGRCGNHVLRDHPNQLSIYLHSDMSFRKERIQQLKNVTEEGARKLINQSDKERSNYYQTFTGKDWMDIRQYDLAINTSKIGLDNSVDLILSYFQML